MLSDVAAIIVEAFLLAYVQIRRWKGPWSAGTYGEASERSFERRSDFCGEVPVLHVIYSRCVRACSLSFSTTVVPRELLMSFHRNR